MKRFICINQNNFGYNLISGPHSTTADLSLIGSFFLRTFCLFDIFVNRMQNVCDFFYYYYFFLDYNFVVVFFFVVVVVVVVEKPRMHTLYILELLKGITYNWTARWNSIFVIVSYDHLFNYYHLARNTVS